MKTTQGKGRNLFLSEVILRPIYTFFHLLTLLILFKKFSGGVEVHCLRHKKLLEGRLNL